MQLVYDIKEIDEKENQKLIKRFDDKNTALTFAHNCCVDNKYSGKGIIFVPVILNDDISDPIELTNNSKKL